MAARVLGVRDAVTELTGATLLDKSVDDLRDHAEREVRARLAPDQSARADAAGRRTSIDTFTNGNDSVSSGRKA